MTMVALAMIGLLATDVLTIDSATRVEARPGDASNRNTSPQSVELDQSFTLLAKTGELSFGASYAPRLILSQPAPAQGKPLEGLNSGTGFVAFQPSRRDRLRLSESFSYGRNEFSSLTAPPAATGTPAPVLDPRLAGVRSVSYAQSTTALQYDRELSRLLHFSTTFSLGFVNVLSGGDPAALAVLPQQGGPQLGAGVSYRASRDDTLVFEALSAYSNLSGSHALTSSAGVTWLRELDSQTRAELGAGLLVARTRGTTYDENPRPIGSASAGLTRVFASSVGVVTASARASIAPVVDRFAGGIYQVGAATASLSWQPERRLNVVASGGVSRGLFGVEQGGQAVQTQGLASFAVNPSLTFSGGVRGAWQMATPEAPVAAVSGLQWTAFVSALFVQRGTF